MKENDYLSPDSIRSQCDAAIAKLLKDNAATYTVEKSLNAFVGNGQIASTAFGALKQQISDYKTVLQAMRTANQSDMEDFLMLKLRVGNQELNGAVILEQKKSALAAKKSDEKNAEKTLSLQMYYTSKVVSYQAMAEADQKMYNAWQEKENRYHEIEGCTSGLFANGAAMRVAAENALNSIRGAFQNGAYVPDMNAAWRGEISSCYINRVMTRNPGGTVKVNWTEVKKILKKDAEQITEEEYNALALLYLNMGEEDMADFLKLCMDKTEDVKDTSKWIGNGSGAYTDMKEDYSVWEINEEKMQNILDRLILASDETLFTLQIVDSELNAEVYNELMNQRDIILQRISLLKAISEIGEFRGWYQENPVVSVKISETGGITLKFCERRDICDTAFAEMSNMGESSIKISETRNEEMINWNAIKEGKTSIEGHLGISFDYGEVDGENISEYIMEQLGNEVLGNMVGSVPYVGSVLTFIMDATDATVDYQSGLNDAQFIAGEFEQLEQENIYTIFGCSANLIAYDAMDNKEKVLFVQPGVNTQAIILGVNTELGTKFTMEDIIARPNEVQNIIDQLLEANPEYRNRFNRGIRGK